PGAFAEVSPRIPGVHDQSVSGPGSRPRGPRRRAAQSQLQGALQDLEELGHPSGIHLLARRLPSAERRRIRDERTRRLDPQRDLDRSDLRFLRTPMTDLVRRRIELKYLLPAAKTRELRAVLTAEPGQHFRRIGGWVTTVYFDLPDRRLARAAMERPEENLKLRLREYFDDEGAPCSPFVWIEIKERQGSSSRKSRFRLHKRLVAPF